MYFNTLDSRYYDYDSCRTALVPMQGRTAQGRVPRPDKLPQEQQQWQQYSGRQQSILAFWPL